MIIWIINPFDPLPGEIIHPWRYWSLAKVLKEKGHNVIWWSSSFNHYDKKQRDINKINDKEFEIRIIKTRPYKKNISLARLVNHRQFAKNFFLTAKDLLNKGELIPPDKYIVSIPPLQISQAVFQLRKIWGGKVILDIQDAWPETFYRFIPGGDKIRKSLGPIVFAPWFQQARRAYAQTNAISGVAKKYIDLALGKRNQIPSLVVPIGISLSLIDKYLPKKRELIPLIKFIYLGSMSDNYDLESIVHATNTLVSKGYELQVLIVGKGPKENSLKKLISSLKLTSTIKLMGYLKFSDMVQILHQSHVALNTIYPSSYIALPNKIGDYTGAGLPIINSISGELNDLLEKYHAGIFYNAGDIGSLMKAMQFYLDNQEIILIQGENSRKLAEDLFDRDKNYPIFAEFIENV
jgi:glycosyltransferase involved in cell wall biosynthesis